MNYEQLNKKILSLTPIQFEEFCRDLIKAMGFFNVDWRRGGSDKGRDIVAEKLYTPDRGITTITEKWFFQCKLYSKGIPENKVSSAIDWAEAEKANYFVIMSNQSLTVPAKEYIEKRKKQLHNVKLLLWTDKNFFDILSGFPYITTQYLPGEKLQIQNNQKTLFELNLKIPQKLFQELMSDISKAISLKDDIRRNILLKIFKEKILDSGLVQDANILALLYQHFSTIFYGLGDIEESNNYINKALKLTPKNKVALAHKAFLFLDQKKYEEAIGVYDTILDIDSQDKIAWNNKGHCLNQIGKKLTAINCFNKALSIDSDFILARHNLGKVYQSKGEFLEAINIFLESLNKNKNSYIILDEIGSLFREIGALDLAINYHEKAISIYPYFEEALINKGVAFEHKAKSTENKEEFKENNDLALKCFEKVIEINQKNNLAFSNKSVCLSNIGNFDEALKFAQKALDLDQKDIRALNQKAFLLNKMNKTDKALDVIREAIKIGGRSDYGKTLYRTEAIIHADRGSHKKAIKIIEKVLELDKHFLGGLNLIIFLYEKIGKEEKAKKYRVLLESRYNELDTILKKILKVINHLKI